MMRSLYSGVSGLKVHQTKMDVIGNNIANVNTTGFKSSTARFSDVFYQTTQAASGPNDVTGTAGKNAMQIGLGASVSSISTSITTTGGAQRTDNALDIMINGDAFFVVNTGGENLFTKDGSFTIDANGNLCTYSGALVMGWPANKETGAVTPDTVEKLQVMSPDRLFSSPEATTAATISGNIDKFDSQITTGRAVQISFYDEMGNKFNAKFEIKQVDGSETEYSVALTDVIDKNNESIFTEYDETTKEYKVKTGIAFSLGGEEYTIAMKDAEKGTLEITGGTQLIKFDGSTGKFVSVGADDSADKNKLAFAINQDGENPYKNIDIDFSSLTMYSTSGKSTLESQMGDLEGANAGKQVGEMTGLAIDASGKIYGKYDNGDSLLLGQIAVATFNNPAGLESVGGNLFSATLNSGEFDGIGQDPSTGGGSLSTGVLEMSNVDLAAQFTDMIVTQRGYQANSRIITTSDTLLEELINLKR